MTAPATAREIYDALDTDCYCTESQTPDFLAIRAANIAIIQQALDAAVANATAAEKAKWMKLIDSLKKGGEA